MSTFGGQAVFGRSVRIEDVPNESAQQVASFFGADGLFSLFGGRRGRVIAVSGLLAGSDVPSLVAAESLLLSFDDGVGRELYDSVRGLTYPVVVFTGAYRRTEPFAPIAGGWAQPYTALFRGNL